MLDFTVRADLPTYIDYTFFHTFEKIDMALGLLRDGSKDSTLPLAVEGLVV